MKITTHRFSTCMGKGNNKDLPFLSESEMKEINSIGYSSKTTNGLSMGREQYLNTLGKGTFNVEQTKRDNGDFCELFMVTRVQPDEFDVSLNDALTEGIEGILLMIDQATKKDDVERWEEAIKVLTNQIK